MKTIKSRNPKAIGFMLRERLANPVDRRNLNILLNDIRTAVLARSKDLSTPQGPSKSEIPKGTPKQKTPLASAVDKLAVATNPVVSTQLGESKQESVAASLLRRLSKMGLTDAH